MTPRRTTDLDPKGRGDKSMSVKRGTAEEVYAVVLQRLSDRAKTALFASQSPGVETAHSSVAHLSSDAIVSHGFDFCSWDTLRDGRCPARACKGMHGEPTSFSDVALRRNTGWPVGREAQGHGVPRVRVGVTPHQGARESRAQGEVAQVVACPAPGRYARCGTPQQDWS